MSYSPVRHFTTPKSLSFDLHVLGAPPAFVLSQDQTLKILLLFTRATKHTQHLTARADDSHATSVHPSPKGGPPFGGFRKHVKPW